MDSLSNAMNCASSVCECVKKSSRYEISILPSLVFNIYFDNANDSTHLT